MFDKTARKLKTKWRGPYVIVDKMGEQNAILRSDKPQCKHFTTHLSKLKGVRVNHCHHKSLGQRRGRSKKGLEAAPTAVL